MKPPRQSGPYPDQFGKAPGAVGSKPQQGFPTAYTDPRSPLYGQTPQAPTPRINPWTGRPMDLDYLPQ